MTVILYKHKFAAPKTGGGLPLIQPKNWGGWSPPSPDDPTPWTTLHSTVVVHPQSPIEIEEIVFPGTFSHFLEILLSYK